MIKETNKVRNLGLIMDRHLTFRPHVEQVVGICTGILLGLSAARHWLPQEVLIVLVDSLVLSRIRYCISVFGNASRETQNKIQKLINFSARVVTGRKRREHISDAVRSLGWLRSPSLYQYGILTRFKTVITTGEPSSLADSIAVQEHTYNTRQTNHYRPVSVRSEVGKRMFGFSAPSLYNSLPQDVRGTAVGCFKKALKEHLLNGV